MQKKTVDIVYIVKERSRNEELRYSLRSVAKHFPHRNVVIAGHLPSFVRGVVHIPTEQRQNKYGNAKGNINAACLSPLVSEDFYLFNDDFFVMRPADDYPQYNRGNLETVLRRFGERISEGPYYKSMERTLEVLKDLDAPQKPFKSYELHLPQLINKQNWLALQDLQLPANPELDHIHSRTLYGNLFELGGKIRKDVKIFELDKGMRRGTDFVSTSDASFAKGPVGEQIRAAFPEPCVYEY